MRLPRARAGVAAALVLVDQAGYSAQSSTANEAGYIMVTGRCRDLGAHARRAACACSHPVRRSLSGGGGEGDAAVDM